MAETFSENKSREYFIDLTLGLEFCEFHSCDTQVLPPVDSPLVHSQHVIHRDIKPQNLLLDNMDRIKVSISLKLSSKGRLLFLNV